MLIPTALGRTILLNKLSLFLQQSLSQFNILWRPLCFKRVSKCFCSQISSIWNCNPTLIFITVTHIIFIPQRFDTLLAFCIKHCVNIIIGRASLVISWLKTGCLKWDIQPSLMLQVINIFRLLKFIDKRAKKPKELCVFYVV